MIGKCSLILLCCFLHLVTGSSVCSEKENLVTYNKLDGLARHPISHTCDNTLKLSIAYISFVELSEEFQRVLLDNEYCWDMIIV